MEHDKIRVGQGQLATIGRSFAVEHGQRAGGELVFYGPNVEEDHRQRARQSGIGGCISDGDFDEKAPTRLHRAPFRFLYPSDHGDLLPHGELGDGGQFAAFDVAAREVVQRLARGGDVEMFCQTVGGFGAQQGLKRLIERIH